MRNGVSRRASTGFGPEVADAAQVRGAHDSSLRGQFLAQAAFAPVLIPAMLIENQNYRPVAPRSLWDKEPRGNPYLGSRRDLDGLNLDVTGGHAAQHCRSSGGPGRESQQLFQSLRGWWGFDCGGALANQLKGSHAAKIANCVSRRSNQ